MDDELRELLTLGKEYYLKRNFVEARSYLEKVVQHTDSFADVHNMLGVIFHDLGQFSQAQNALENALRINPAYTEAALNLAVLYNDLGEYDRAKEVYRTALKQSRNATDTLEPFVAGKIANMHADVADAYRSAGHLELAIAEYRKAVELGPGFVDIRTRLASALRDFGQPEQAATECQKAIAERDEYIPAHIILGVCYYSLGRSEDALAEWRWVLERDPDNARAMTYTSMVKAS